MTGIRTMQAMQLRGVCSVLDNDRPLTPVTLPVPTVGQGEVLLEVSACGVCHTELDEIEGRLVPRLPVVPGHEVVGRIIERGPGVIDHALGDRVGVGWIHHSSGAEDENLSSGFRSTGCDVDGGYAQYMVVPEQYAVPIPDTIEDTQAAPLLCAGAIGYRALRLSGLREGQRLGLMGFGGSAHIVAQLSRHLFPESSIYAFARDAESRAFALELGAAWSGAIEDQPPERLDAIIDTTPAWLPVVAALGNLRPGGRLVINAIRKEADDQSALLSLSYPEHLWMEKEIKSVANITRRDLSEFLPIAAQIPIRSTIQTYPLAQANEALVALKREPVRGAKVLIMPPAAD